MMPNNLLAVPHQYIGVLRVRAQAKLRRNIVVKHLSRLRRLASRGRARLQRSEESAPKHLRSLDLPGPGQELRNCGKGEPTKSTGLRLALICIAGDFNRYDELAAKQMQRNIELIRYRRFGNAVMMLDRKAIARHEFGA